MHIGVVVPAYNAAAWVGGAIASVLAQTHRDWSLVVVDDGSVSYTHLRAHETYEGISFAGLCV